MPRVSRRPSRPSRLSRLSPFRSLALAAAALVVAACSSAGGGTSSQSVAGATSPPGWPEPGSAITSGPVPVVASSELIVGQNRFIYTIVDSKNNVIAAPGLITRVAFFDLDTDPARPTAKVDGRFLWAIPNQRGFYVAQVRFPSAGHWGVQVDTSGTIASTTRVRFDVQPKGTSVPVGGKAPADATPTLATAGGDVHRLSSDTNPDPAFYTTSVSEALAAHRPFALIFATPAFCTSRVCGPMLDQLKTLAAGEPGFTFINVEPYELQWNAGRLQPVLDASGNLKPTKVTDDWGIPAEPWIFVVDKEGIVRGSYEAVVGSDELRAAIDAVK